MTARPGIPPDQLDAVAARPSPRLAIPQARQAALAAKLAGPPFEQPPSPLENPSLPHQIVSLLTGGGIAVTCNCLRHGGRGCRRQLIAFRTLGQAFPWAEAVSAWRGWHADRGVSV